MKTPESLNKSRFSYRDLMDPQDDYGPLDAYLKRLCEEGRIRPIKKSGRFSASFEFYREYFVCGKSEEPMIDPGEINRLAPVLLEYYSSHSLHYEEDRFWLVPLSEWMKNSPHHECSLKERSYEIYRDEKMLESLPLRRIMNRCHLGYDALFCYRTYEPFFCEKISGRGIALVTENKDPWYSLIRALRQKNTSRFMGTEIMYLIYGEGRKADSAAENSRLQDFIASLVPQPERVYYCGDIDRAGVAIYSRCRDVNPALDLKPFLPLYLAMEKKAPENVTENEPAEDSRTKSWEQDFAGMFAKPEYIQTVLEMNRRIPQEILSLVDYCLMCGD